MGPERLFLRPASLILALSVAAASASCGDETGGAGGEALPDDALVLVVSTDLAVGRERVLVSALDRDNRSLVTDRPVRLAFFAPRRRRRRGGTGPLRPGPSPTCGACGRPKSSSTPPASGRWRCGQPTTAWSGAPRSAWPPPRAPSGWGERAPPSRSKTQADGPLESITSDPDPDPRLYEMTVAEAVGSGRPSVIVFATPAFCTGQTCGPVLDAAKSLIDRRPDVNWVHVEVYDNLDAAGPENLVLAEPVSEWGLPTEPWVFLVDADGVVTDRFEGVVGPAELEEALARVTG